MVLKINRSAVLARETMVFEVKSDSGTTILTVSQLVELDLGIVPYQEVQQQQIMGARAIIFVGWKKVNGYCIVFIFYSYVYFIIRIVEISTHTKH